MATTPIFRGFSTVDSSIKQTTYTDLELIKRDLVNAFYTRIGERVMKPNYGCIIWDMLYEQMTEDAVSLIRENCVSLIQADGRVVMTDFNLIQFDHGLQLQLDLFYPGFNISDQFSLNFDQQSASEAQS